MSLEELFYLNEICFNVRKPLVTPLFGEHEIVLTDNRLVTNMFIFTGQRTLLRIGTDHAAYFDDYCNLGDVLKDLAILPSFYSSIRFSCFSQVSNLIHKDGGLLPDTMSIDGNIKQGYSLISRRTTTTTQEAKQMCSTIRYYLLEYNQTALMRL